MRRYAPFFVIAVMSFGLLFLLLTRARTPHDAPQAIREEETAEPDAAADAGQEDAAEAIAAVDAAPPLPTHARPLRVTALGWELVVAGAALAEADAGAPGMELSPELALDPVEARLARGGDDPEGADVAILPLPALVSAYDRLRALEPKAFLVVGFSHGREEVHAVAGGLSKPPSGAGEVKLVALGPPTASEASMQKAGSESATVLGLFALDLVGIAPSRVRFVATGTEAAKGAAYSAIVHGAADERKLAFSTADASRFVPIVAVAGKAELESHPKELEAWARAWLDGLARAGRDAPGAARRLAAKEGVPLGASVSAAPEALHLVERLGQIEPATVEREAELAASLSSLTPRIWQLARGAGLTTSSAPDPLPIEPRIVASVAPAAKKPAEAGGSFPALPPSTTPLVVYRAPPDSDADAVAKQIGFLAGVFERAVFRVRARGGEKTARAIAAAAHDAQGVPESRIDAVAVEPQGAFAAVEVLSPP